MTRNMDNWGTGDMTIPEIKLVQFLGSERAKEVLKAVPGDFYCGLTDEVYKAGLDIVLVDMQKTRTFWGRSEIFDEPPICASLNADSQLSDDGKDCQDCANRCDAPWLLSAAERRNKCTISYTVMAINLGTGMPVIIRCGGINSGAARDLFTQLRTNKALKGEYHRAKIHLSSEKKKSPSGESYMMRFKITGTIEDKVQIEELKAQSLQLLGSPAPVSLPERSEVEPEAAADAGAKLEPSQKTIPVPVTPEPDLEF